MTKLAAVGGTPTGRDSRDGYPTFHISGRLGCRGGDWGLGIGDWRLEIGDWRLIRKRKMGTTDYTDYQRVMKAVAFIPWVNAVNLVTHSLSVCICVCMPFRVHPWFKFFSRLIILEAMPMSGGRAWDLELCYPGHQAGRPLVETAGTVVLHC